MKDREDLQKVTVKPVNQAADRLQRKEENDKRIQKEEFRKKEQIMEDIRKPKDEIEQAIFEKMNDFVMKKGRRQFFKYYLVTNDTQAAANQVDKYIQKRPLIESLKFNNMYDKSLAEKKRIWKGEQGTFKKSYVQDWFKVWDETRLFQNRNQVIDPNKKAVQH